MHNLKYSKTRDTRIDAIHRALKNAGFDVTTSVTHKPSEFMIKVYSYKRRKR